MIGDDNGDIDDDDDDGHDDLWLLKSLMVLSIDTPYLVLLYFRSHCLPSNLLPRFNAKDALFDILFGRLKIVIIIMMIIDEGDGNNGR